MHFFRSEDSYQPYAEFVREDYLERLFAETKILCGQRRHGAVVLACSTTRPTTRR